MLIKSDSVIGQDHIRQSDHNLPDNPVIISSSGRPEDGSHINLIINHGTSPLVSVLHNFSSSETVIPKSDDSSFG